VLAAHGVEAVELIWRSDSQGWVLYLTVERPGTSDPTLGITLDLCAELSRDLSAALDVADVIAARYRLEVGSPGLDRALYGVRDYERFAGRMAKVKLREPVLGQRVVRGELKGLGSDGKVVLVSDGKELSLDPADIESGRLAFDWQASLGKKKGSANRPARRGRSART
jgi:ribosome maturation factor RimP